MPMAAHDGNATRYADCPTCCRSDVLTPLRWQAAEAAQGAGVVTTLTELIATIAGEKRIEQQPVPSTTRPRHRDQQDVVANARPTCLMCGGTRGGRSRHDCRRSRHQGESEAAMATSFRCRWRHRDRPAQCGSVMIPSPRNRHDVSRPLQGRHSACLSVAGPRHDGRCRLCRSARAVPVFDGAIHTCSPRLSETRRRTRRLSRRRDDDQTASRHQLHVHWVARPRLPSARRGAPLVVSTPAAARCARFRQHAIAVAAAVIMKSTASKGGVGQAGTRRDSGDDALGLRLARSSHRWEPVRDSIGRPRPSPTVVLMTGRRPPVMVPVLSGRQR